ncbi:MAG: hypothetical protein HYZ68_06535 [Chloroflexi bacterium]|nr:hypothetical protein [Chloroflexota bacterium]
MEKKEARKETKRERMVEVEERADAPYDILHLRVAVPKRLLPRETQKHAKAAIREMLLTGRSLLDVFIEELEGEAGASRTERIQVD